MNSRLPFWASLCLLAFSAANSFAASDSPQGSVSFDQGALEINAGVERFANSLAKGLFNDFSVTEVKFARDTNGQVINEFQSGRANGTFHGILERDDKQSLIDADFSVATGIEPLRQKEYEIHFRASGKVHNPRILLNRFVDGRSKACSSRRYSEELFSSPSLCGLSVAKFSGLSAPELAKLLIESVKADLLENISEASHPELDKVRERLLSYLDQQIVVESSEEETFVSIDLSDLASQFRGEAGLFLNSYDLIDYHYNLIEFRVSRDEMSFEYHMVKLHVAGMFTTYMTALSKLQTTMEDPSIGLQVGADLRNGVGVKAALKQNSTWADYFSAGKVLGNAFISGEPEVELDLDDEDAEDLGID